MCSLESVNAQGDWDVANKQAAVVPLQPVVRQSLKCPSPNASSQSVASNSPVGLKYYLPCLGTGTFSKVYRVSTGSTHYALKCVDKAVVVQHSAQSQLMSEVQLLRECTHQFVIRLIKAFETPKQLFLMLELVGGGEFFSYLSKRGNLPEYDARFYGANVLLALEHLHSLQIAYRDLKPENLVMDAQGFLRVVDLGFSAKVFAVMCCMYTLLAVGEIGASAGSSWSAAVHSVRDS